MNYQFLKNSRTYLVAGAIGLATTLYTPNSQGFSYFSIFPPKVEILSKSHGFESGITSKFEECSKFENGCSGIPKGVTLERIILEEKNPS